MTAPRAVLDAHVHFWDPALREYPWLAALPPLRRSFAPAEFARDSARAPIAGAVFVECNCDPTRALEEARWVAGLPRDGSPVVGIVAFADLTRAEALPDALDAYAGIDGVCGIRHNIQGNPPGFALQDRFVEGVREVGRRGFTFDLCATHDQLPEVVQLARRCPHTRLVLDHCGKPDIAGGSVDPWRMHVAELASLPNVWCKLSGLLTEARVPGWRAADLRPYAEHVVEAFGRDRVMYGGDWPVLTLAGTYRAWYQFTLRFTRNWAERERAGFYRENALGFYGIATGPDDGQG